MAWASDNKPYAPDLIDRFASNLQLDESLDQKPYAPDLYLRVDLEGKIEQDYERLADEEEWLRYSKRDMASKVPVLGQLRARWGDKIVHKKCEEDVSVVLV